MTGYVLLCLVIVYLSLRIDNLRRQIKRLDIDLTKLEEKVKQLGGENGD